MKGVGIGIAVLLGIGQTQTRAQFLGGIFSQGTTELKNNAAQIVALQALGATDQEDYEQLIDGLTGIGSIHGAEYTLHIDYFASLAAVNPAVAGMPEVADIVSTVAAVSSGLSAAITRWIGSGGLSPGELGAMVELDSSLGRQGSSELLALRSVLTAGQLVMPDAERVARIRAIDRTVREQYAFMIQACAEGDGLASRRRQIVGQAGVMLEYYGGP